MQRQLQMTPKATIEPCPKCSNRVIFTAHSQQFAEDCCEVWLVCQCGFDPTAERHSHRLESVMGGVGDGNVLNAIDVWNDLLTSNESH